MYDLQTFKIIQIFLGSGDAIRKMNLKSTSRGSITAALSGVNKSAVGYVIGPRGIELTEREPEALRRSYFADIHYGYTLLHAGRIIKIVGKR
jgi:hypothetical protein